MPPRSMRRSCPPVNLKEGEDASKKLLLETVKRNNVKFLAIYESWGKRVKDWIKDAEKPENSEPRVGKKGGRLHNSWAARDTKIKELEAENKKLKVKNKELKGSGGAMSTSTAGAHDE